MTLSIDIGVLLRALGERTGVQLPRGVISMSLVGGVLHVRFRYPEADEADVEPPTRTPCTSSGMGRWGGDRARSVGVEKLLVG